MFPHKAMLCADSPDTVDVSKAEVAAFARALKCPVVIYHAVHPIWGGLEAHRERRAAEAEKIAAFKGDPAFAGIDLSIICDRESPDIIRGVVDHARDLEVDLLIVPVHERRGLKRLVFRSIGEEITRSCSLPVLTFDLERMPQVQEPEVFDRVIAPTDFSDPSLAAVTMAGRIAARLGAPLTLVHAVSESLVVGGSFTPEDLSSVVAQREAAMSDARAAAAPIAEAVRQETGVEALADVEVGLIVDVVASRVAEAANPLVVMSTAGRDSLGDHVFGSRTERVIRRGGCSVLSLPPAFTAAYVSRLSSRT